MKKSILCVSISVLVLALASCDRESGEKTGTVTERVADKVSSAVDRFAVPMADRNEQPVNREQERFSEDWRRVRTFNAQQAQRAQQQRAQAAAVANLRFAPNAKESFENLTMAQINNAPIAVPIEGDKSGPSVLKTQVYLDRLNFSVGALDGRWGKNSAIALWWFQRTHGLEATGKVDEQTFRRLAAEAGGAQAVVTHTLTAEDVKGPFISIPEDVYEKAKLDCLCYESVAEKLAERFHTTTGLLERLNPEVKLSGLQEGQTINVPNVRAPVTSDRADIARVVISVSGSTFDAYDASGNLVFHAPTTLGSKYDPSPSETVTVTKIAHDPHFHYQPKLFHEVPDDEPEATLNPGPNSPVGVVWIALSKPHFGVHGTSDPESIGYASSHGCVRLTNWDAKEVAHRISPKVPIEFTDTRSGS